MGEQFSLFDDDALPPAPKSPPPPRKGRTTGLFFAILPPQDVIAEIVECRASLFDKLDVHDRPFAAERFHVTVCPLGSDYEIPEGFVDVVCKAADTVDVEPFGVAFDHVLTFRSGSKTPPTVLVSSDEMQPLAELHQKLRAALLKVGVKTCLVVTHAASDPILRQRG